MSMTRREDNTHYISLSDMMTALMLIFLFISVCAIQSSRRDENTVAEEFFEAKEKLHDALEKQFKNDLERWDAKLNDDLSFHFNGDAAQFDTNDATLKPEFQEKLAEFFPNYIKTISKYKDIIQEIRIEGHTDKTGPCNPRSSEPCIMRAGPYSINGDYTNEQKNYLYNMALSQARARNVLSYCLTLTPDFNGMKEYVTANGLSYSTGRDNRPASRRVEFRVLLRAEESMNKLKGKK